MIKGVRRDDVYRPYSWDQLCRGCGPVGAVNLRRKGLVLGDFAIKRGSDGISEVLIYPSKHRTWGFRISWVAVGAVGQLC